LPSNQTSALNLLVFPGSLLAVATVVFTDSFVPLFAYVILFVLAIGQVIWRAPLLPISEAQAKSNKKWGNIVVLVVALGVVFWWLYSHG
jgi:hypothetical protein